jgi:hypothetical protein
MDDVIKSHEQDTGEGTNDANKKHSRRYAHRTLYGRLSATGPRVEGYTK